MKLQSNLTDNELELFTIIVENGTQSEGIDMYPDGECNGIELDSVYNAATSAGHSKANIKGTLSTLQEKGLVLMYGKGFECYFDGEVTQNGIDFYNANIKPNKVTK